MADWKESLKRLIGTPPAMGVTIATTPIESCMKKVGKDINWYVKREIAVYCDPDALEQTARKNAELMEMLANINEVLESGELVEQRRGWWQPSGWSLIGQKAFKCSECNFAVADVDDVYMNYCPGCGAKMDDERMVRQ